MPACAAAEANSSALGDLGIRVGLEAPYVSIRADPVVDTGVPAQPQDPVNALAEVRQGGLDGRKEVHSRLLFDPMALLVLQVVLDLLGRDDGRIAVLARDDQLPSRQCREAFVPKDSDVDLPPFNELFGDRVGFHAAVHELHALFEFRIIVHDRRLGNAQRRVLGEALHDEREREVPRAFHLESHREGMKRRDPDPVIHEQLLRQGLLARDDQSARVAAGVRHAQQLEQADDVLVEEDVALEFLEQVEREVRLEFVDRITDRVQLVLHAKGAHFMAELLQGAGDVVFGLVRKPDFGGQRHGIRWRDQVRMHQGQHFQSFHRITGRSSRAAPASKGSALS